MRFPHPALLFLTLGAGLAACNGGDTDGGPIDPGPQPKKRGTITVVGGTEGIHVGEIRTLTEQFEDAGAIRVEWDLDFDGTTFTVDRTLDTPTAGQEPVTLFFGEAGTHTVAMRGVFPEEEFTEIAAVALTVLPPEDPFHFRAVQRELAERTWDPAVGGYASPYVEIVAGDQALARNGRRLLAGYYSLKAGGVLRYYLVASNDLGSTWGPPTVMSAHADDQPFLDKQPEVTIAPLGTEFLVAWISTAGRLHKARVIVPDERAPVPVRGTRDFGPRVPGETAAQLPLLLPHPTNPGVVRLLGAASTADKPNGILSAEEITGDGGPAITSRDLPAIDVSPQRITALEGTWPDQPLVLALELALLETTGGFGGGTSVTRTLQVRTVLDEGGETAQLAETSGSPLSTPRYLPAIAAGTGRFVVADVFGEDITLIRGTYATDGRIEVGTVGPLDLTTGATAVELAFLGNAFQVLYALPVNPLGSDEFRQNVQVAAAQFPLDPGPAIYFDRPVDRDGDTDSHRTPTVIGGPDGEALAVWVGAVEGRHTWGRLSFNRTH